jgi:hypothetical protein
MSNLIKKLVWAGSVMAMGGAILLAQPTSAPPASAAAVTNVLAPKIQFETPIYDFGRVKSGELVKHNFVFTNTGNALLIINSVNPGCGCTTIGDWTKQVEPGMTGVVPIQFNTANYNGPVIKTPSLNCNITNQPTVVMQLKGTVYKPYDVIPPVAVLNILPDSDRASVVVTITNQTEELLMLAAPESNNRMFAAELKTNVLGKGYELTISTVPPLGMGNVQAQISLRTGWTNPPNISVTAVANIQPAVMVIPSYVTLAAGPLPSAVTNSISIRNQSTNVVQIYEATVNMSGAQVEIKETQPGKAFTALVSFPEGFQVPPGQAAELNFKTTHPKFPQMKVPVMQMPRPNPPPVPMSAPIKPPPTPQASLPSIAPPPPAAH